MQARRTFRLRARATRVRSRRPNQAVPQFASTSNPANSASQRLLRLPQLLHAFLQGRGDRIVRRTANSRRSGRCDRSWRHRTSGDRSCDADASKLPVSDADRPGRGKWTAATAIAGTCGRRPRLPAGEDRRSGGCLKSVSAGYSSLRGGPKTASILQHREGSLARLHHAIITKETFTLLYLSASRHKQQPDPNNSTRGRIARSYARVACGKPDQTFVLGRCLARQPPTLRDPTRDRHIVIQIAGKPSNLRFSTTIAQIPLGGLACASPKSPCGLYRVGHDWSP